MKIKLTILFLFFCFGTKLTAQDVVLYTGKKDYIPAKVILTNGKAINGYIKDFTLPKFIQFQGPFSEFKPFEKRLNLDRTNFRFKYNPEGESIPIHADSIQTILLNEDKPVEYEKMKLKTINSKNKLVDTDLEVFLPLIKRGDIDLYGLNVVDKHDKLITVLAYIKKPEDNFAVIPIDMSRLNIFNAWSIGERFITGFMEITKDCDAYQALLQDELNKLKKKDKQYVKESEQQFKDYMAQNCNNCNPEELFSSFYFQRYKDMIDNYSNMCD
jgi:hypothetical protein